MLSPRRWVATALHRRARAQRLLAMRVAVNAAQGRYLLTYGGRGPAAYALACAYARLTGSKRPMTDVERDNLKARVRAALAALQNKTTS